MAEFTYIQQLHTSSVKHRHTLRKPTFKTTVHCLRTHLY